MGQSLEREIAKIVKVIEGRLGEPKERILRSIMAALQKMENINKAVIERVNWEPIELI